MEKPANDIGQVSLDLVPAMIPIDKSFQLDR